MKMNTKTKIRSNIKKVVKNSKSTETVSIQLKKISKKETNYNVHELAKNLKSRLSNVAKRLTSDVAVNNNKGEKQQLTELNSPCNEVTTTTTTSLPLDSPPTTPTTMLSNSDWSDNQLESTTTTTTSLYHLQLLGQYLTFVSQETNNISLENDTINITVSNDDTELITPESDIQQASRLGATLIELSIHDPSMKIESCKRKNPNGVSRRRPGRPPKSIQKLLNDDNNNEQLVKNKRHTIIQRHQRQQQQQQQQQQKKKESIDCICNVAHEEFGTMVQCDDCLSWLHLDCLELNEKALQETFRCPSCFIKFGANGEDKLLSTVTWRYAAKYQSEVLAAAGYQKDDEEEEEEEEEDMEIDNQFSVFSYKSTPPLVPVVVPNTTSMFDLCLVSEDNNDLCDSLSSQDGYSEASTPSEYQTNSDDYWFAPPSAANVFLWENQHQQQQQQQSHYYHLLDDKINNLTTTSLLSDIEPSSICDQELPKFNFWDVTF